MSAYPAPTLRALDALTNRQAHAEALAAAARVSLLEEFTHALSTDPNAIVSTPGFRCKSQPAYAVMYDAFAGRSGEAWSIELAGILAACSQGKDAQARAQALIEAMSESHADFHAADAVGGSA